MEAVIAVTQGIRNIDDVYINLGPVVVGSPLPVPESRVENRDYVDIGAHSWYDANGAGGAGAGGASGAGFYKSLGNVTNSDVVIIYKNAGLRKRLILPKGTVLSDSIIRDNSGNVGGLEYIAGRLGIVPEII